jgi:hypothetical protein
MRKVEFYLTKDRGVNIPELDLYDYSEEQKRDIEKSVSESPVVLRCMIGDVREVNGEVVVSEPEEIHFGISPVQMIMVDG